MKEIKLNCFTSNETCQITSDLKNFSISSPLENQYLLEITNQSENDCSVDLQLKRIDQSENLTRINLLVAMEEELFFQNSLEVFSRQEIPLGLIESRVSNKYFLTFDFINLSVENKKIILNFDFLLNFHCLDLVKENFALTDSSSSKIPQKENKSEVLAAVDNRNNLMPVFYLLSSLFILVFFVIIKFVNGKKKKNKE